MSTTTTYKNVSEADQTLVGFGVIAAGDTIETSEVITHPAFEVVEPEKRSAKQKEVKADE